MTEAETPPVKVQNTAIEPAKNAEEPFWLSVRFYASMITPIIAALVTMYSEAIPWLSSLDQNELAIWIGGLVVTAVAFIVGRTKRNIDLSGGLAQIRTPRRYPVIPGKVVGLRIVRASLEGVDQGGPKEPLLASKRLWVAVLTPLFAALFGHLAKTIPEAGQIEPAAVAAVMASWFLMGAGYIMARSWRNTKIPA